MNDNIIIDLKVTWPYGRKTVHRSIELCAHTFRDAFTALPQDREIPFCSNSAILAAKQMEERRMVARMIAEQLIDSLSEQDTVEGYTKEQWESMNAQEKGAP